MGLLTGRLMLVDFYNRGVVLIARLANPQRLGHRQLKHPFSSFVKKITAIISVTRHEFAI